MDFLRVCSCDFMHRCFKSGIVRQIPTNKEIEYLKKKYPDLLIKINIQRDMDLENMAPHHIDSYSYVIANIVLGAQSREELIEKYHDVIDKLTIEINYR